MVEIDYNRFICKQGWFSLQLSAKWMEYGFEEGMYEFVSNCESEANLRILPVRFHESDMESAFNYVEDVYENSLLKSPEKTKIDGCNCVSFKEAVEISEVNTYYWFLEKQNFVFIFSLSIPFEQDRIPSNEEELKEIKSVIASVEII